MRLAQRIVALPLGLVKGVFCWIQKLPVFGKRCFLPGAQVARMASDYWRREAVWLGTGGGGRLGGSGCWWGLALFFLFLEVFLVDVFFLKDLSVLFFGVGF